MAVGLGVDFEHIYHTPAYRSLDGSPEIPLDLQSITDTILDLLGRADANATFFVVAELAEDHPDLVRRIVSHGHEIASHTVTHPSLPALSNAEVRDEVRESKAVLERISGEPVAGFRAPTCQLDDRVYTELADAGYTYSSSVMPSVPVPGFYSDTYGFERPTAVRTDTGTVTELPLAVSPYVPLPVSGAWTRLLGRRFLIRSVRRLLEAGHPVLTYVHPWEFAALQDTPLPVRNRFRTGNWVGETYERLLDVDADFLTVRDLLERSPPDEEYAVTG